MLQTITIMLLALPLSVAIASPPVQPVTCQEITAVVAALENSRQAGVPAESAQWLWDAILRRATGTDPEAAVAQLAAMAQTITTYVYTHPDLTAEQLIQYAEQLCAQHQIPRASAESSTPFMGPPRVRVVEESPWNTVVGLLGVGFIFLLYFLPTCIAMVRNHRHLWIIAGGNLLFVWIITRGFATLLMEVYSAIFDDLRHPVVLVMGCLWLVLLIWACWPRCERLSTTTSTTTRRRLLLAAWNPFDATVPPLQKAAVQIRLGWIMALISAGITTLFALTGTMGFTAWNLADTALTIGLGWGIYGKSRIAATTMVCYFILGQALMTFDATTEYRPSIMALFFCWLYVLAMVGTFRWHRLNRQTASA